jgi:protein SCO1/2
MRSKIINDEIVAMNIHMKNFCRVLTASWIAGSALLLSGAAPAHDAKEHAAASAAGDYKRSVRSYSIPDVVLIDADAKPVRLRELLAAKDPVMLNFIFTTCGAICPVMSKVFSDVPAQLGAEATKLRMISISIDPENDTPAQLKLYAKTYGANARWKFLTGSVEDVKAVQRAFNSYRGDKMSHEPLTLLHSAPDKPWVRIDGFASPEELAREYRKVALQ